MPISDIIPKTYQYQAFRKYKTSRLKKLYYEQAALPPTRTIDSFDEDAVLTEVCQDMDIYLFHLGCIVGKKRDPRIPDPGPFSAKIRKF